MNSKSSASFELILLIDTLPTFRMVFIYIGPRRQKSRRIEAQIIVFIT